MINDPVLSEIGLVDDWIKSGIVNHDNYLSIKNNYLEHRKEDSCTEHYRLRAFRNFLNISNSIDKDTFLIIYSLGKNDSDYYMGRTMIFELLDRADCPIELIDTVIIEGDPSLSKRALKLKNNKPK